MTIRQDFQLKKKICATIHKNKKNYRDEKKDRNNDSDKLPEDLTPSERLLRCSKLLVRCYNQTLGKKN